VSEKNEIKLDLTKTANESNVQITSNKVCNLGRISKIAASPRDIEPYENDVFQIFWKQYKPRHFKRTLKPVLTEYVETGHLIWLNNES